MLMSKPPKPARLGDGVLILAREHQPVAFAVHLINEVCLLYTSPSPRD